MAEAGPYKVVGQAEDELDAILLCLEHEIVQPLPAHCPKSTGEVRSG